MLPDDDELYARDQIAERRRGRERYRLKNQGALKNREKVPCYCPAGHSLFENGIKVATLKKRGIPVAARTEQFMKLTRNDFERLNMICRDCANN